MDSEEDKKHIANVDEHDLLWNSIANLELDNNKLVKRIEILEGYLFGKEGGDKRQS